MTAVAAFVATACYLLAGYAALTLCRLVTAGRPAARIYTAELVVIVAAWPAVLVLLGLAFAMIAATRTTPRSPR